MQQVARNLTDSEVGALRASDIWCMTSRIRSNADDLSDFEGFERNRRAVPALRSCFVDRQAVTRQSVRSAWQAQCPDHIRDLDLRIDLDERQATFDEENGVNGKT
jgi:hypothetical protein